MIATTAFTRRLVGRILSRGILDTSRYCFLVAANAVRSTHIDLRYGRKLSTTRLDANRALTDCHGIMHTEWRFLDAIFSAVEIRPTDVLVDVGCGDGRVLNYWLSRGLRNRLLGIEIDAATAADTAMRLQRYPNVEIMAGDAVEQASSCGGTLFYLYNPFAGSKLAAFERAIRQCGARIIFYNFVDLSPFSDEHWDIRIVTCKEDALQYRVAMMVPRAQS